nr:MAG TPA: hypothetical protein [Caudoviricetes sp.]
MVLGGSLHWIFQAVSRNMLLNIYKLNKKSIAIQILASIFA